MSFILDALKKSEAERQRKSTPGVADIPNARPSSRAPRWLWIVAGLLTVNLAVLAAVLLRPGAEAGTATVTRALAVPDTAAPSPSFSELVAEAKERQRTAGPAEPQPSEEPPGSLRDEAPAVAKPAPEPDPVDFGALATFDELRARGELMLPDLHLDLHVYADKPADRFVVINMTRYREGAALAEGPRVRQILPNGAVLEQRGTAFFLPR